MLFFYSDGDVNVDFESKDNKMTIKYDVLNSQNGTKIENIYFMQSEKDIDVIEVLVNGEPIPFDRVRALYD